jgi:hypothetical protein
LKTTRVITAKTVQRCFREAAKGRRFPLPDIEECEVIAERVTECAGRVDQVLPGADVLGSAREPAKRLLNHLPKIRDNIRKEYLDLQTLGLAPQDNRHLAGVIQVDQLSKLLSELLGRYGGKPRTYKWHDLAGTISAYGTAGWRGGFDPEIFPANLPSKLVGRWYKRWLKQDSKRQHRAPMSTDAEGPLCRFVQLMLKELGFHRGIEAISAAIRGRRGPRSRETRDKKHPAKMSAD